MSVNREGTDSGNNGHDYVISADGRFVAFRSEASDLVATDTNGSLDVLVRDLQKGTTTLVSAPGGHGQHQWQSRSDPSH